MPKRTIKLGKWSTTSYKRSDKCEIVYVPTGWNILDEEQRRDLEFIYSSHNRAGKIRECVRMARLGRLQNPMLSMPMTTDDVTYGDEEESVSDDDVLNSLL